jgi:hypothetical protein
VKYLRTPGFLIDLRRLPEEHRKLFVEAVHEILRPALDAGAHKGTVPWPRALRPMAGRCSGWPRSLAKQSWYGCASATTASTTPEEFSLAQAVVGLSAAWHHAR